MTEETVTTTEEVDANLAPEPTETENAVEEEAQTVEEPTEESDAEGEHAEVEDEVKPDPRDRKLAELSYKERELKRQNAQLMKMLEQDRALANQSNAPQPPKIEDFETLDDYLNARDEWRDNQKAPQEQPRAEQSDVDIDYQLSTDELYAHGVSKHPDFVDVVGAEHVPITPIMADAIFTIEELDLQADTAYFLGNNLKEAARISKLPPVRQIAEVARLADKIEAKRSAPKSVAKSKAPEPIKPVGGTKTPTDEIRPGESFESFMKKRNKQLGR